MPPVDDVSSELSRYYFQTLKDVGVVRAGVAAEPAGLRSADDAVAAMRAAGLELTGTPHVDGEQTRSIRETVELFSRNPFVALAPRHIVAAIPMAFPSIRVTNVDRNSTSPRSSGSDCRCRPARRPQIGTPGAGLAPRGRAGAPGHGWLHDRGH